MTRVLYLTLKKYWFQQIRDGKKKEEYRDHKQFWISRLAGKTFDEIYFKNGYREKSPFMRVQCLGITVVGDKFVIKLGKILELRE